MDKTKIEWTDATWSPITGCSRISEGCEHCYAERLAGTRMKNHPSRSGLTRDTLHGPVWTGDVRFNELWLDEPLRWTRSRKVFTVAHGDLFHENVPDEWIAAVYGIMALTPQHTFQVLTKRSRRMREWTDAYNPADCIAAAYVHRPAIAARWPLDKARAAGVGTRGWPLPNVHAGVSVENDDARYRIADLARTQAAVRWVSAEPLIGSLDMTTVPDHVVDATFNALTGMSELYPEEPGYPMLDWVVVGGESGPGARPMHPDWARSIRDQSVAAGVPFFFKQWGDWIQGEYLGRGIYRKPAKYSDEHRTGGDVFFRIGKSAAGRLLDGRTWDEMPA